MSRQSRGGLPPAAIGGAIQVEVVAPNQIRMHLLNDGRRLASIDLDVPAAGHAAGILLNAAYQASPKTPDLPALWSKYEGPVIPISTIGLAENLIPNHESLILRIGDTSLAMSIPHAILSGLGAAMIAATAPKTAKN